MKCECGGTFVQLPDSEGLWCDKCGAYTDRPDDYKPESFDELRSQIYDPERLKSVKGVPTITIMLGSESKGRVSVPIPSFCSEAESKAIIKYSLDLLEYAKKDVERRGLDIYARRSKE